MALQVIGAGFGRTGTLSFKYAMEQLGFGPCHHMRDIFMGEPDVEVWAAAAAGTLTDWDLLYGAYRATCDFPHCVFYEELAAFYPDAKVVLTVRDPESWYRSAIDTIFSPQTRERMAHGDGSARAARMADALTTVISRVIDTRADLSKQEMIDAFLAHNEAVQAIIPADRLLVFEASQGWEPLCDFLSVPVPETPYPRVNTTKEFQARPAAPATRPDGPTGPADG